MLATRFRLPKSQRIELTSCARTVYMFVQVRADEFVKYDVMAQKLCEVSLSLTLYPPGHASIDTTTTFIQAQRGSEFSAVTSYTNLRNATREYFANPKNRLYADKATSNPNFDFEAEVGVRK